jgi:hypothetical protein
MSQWKSMKPHENAFVECITTWWSREMEERAQYQGWNTYLVTFTFNPIAGDRAAPKLKIMQNSVCRFYSTLIKHVVRKPNSIYQMHKRPRMIAAPDYPVFKHEKISLAEARVNDGLHMHAILGVPLKSRLKESVSTHVDGRRHAYIKTPLRNIHFEYVEHDMDHVVDYALKAIKRGRCSWEDLLFLPKSPSELSSK